jgi:ABC-type transporter Mla subunit MlaD
MPDNTSSGFGDLLGAFGANNPLTGLTRSVAQFQRGVNEFLSTIENLNNALEQFNQVSARVNMLLDLVEEPLKAFVPQVTRTIRAADDLVERLSSPIDRVAPGLARLADTLSNPVLTSLPKDLNEFLAVLRDLARRLQPLGQMAETAGGLFSRGPFASFLGGTPRPEPAQPAVAAPAPVDEYLAPRPAAARPARKAPAKKAPAKKQAATRAPAKHAPTTVTKRATPPR